MVETLKALTNDELKAATCQSLSASSREDLTYRRWGKTILNDELLAKKCRGRRVGGIWRRCGGGEAGRASALLGFG
ncbi:hypothetical protein PanWU01x14_340600 [Parasponia andersonii]|uniref:Uncharacterized protein n=1 Tax=Parasponia andersonii TaxID=3476 RepID=A0A2P5AEG0_PARAD|nr:hypothetical protein PanWU01x14_340600 [Parasponia andersonii]